MAAIYMWIDAEVMYLTTTLYPVEVIDALQLGGRLGTNPGMYLIPNEGVDNFEVFLSGELRQLLKSTPTYFEAIDNVEVFLSGELRQLLKSTDVFPEALDNTETFLSGYLDLALVTVDSPDEALEFSCRLDTANCSLTLI